MYLEAFAMNDILITPHVLNSERLEYYEDIFDRRDEQTPFSENLKVLDEPLTRDTNEAFIFHAPEDSFDRLREFDFDGVIISGSTLSVEDKPDFVIHLRKYVRYLWKRNIPTLAICYGQQLITDVFGGTVGKFSEEKQPFNVHSREQGLVPLFLTPAGKKSDLFKGLPDCFFIYSGHKYFVKEPPSAQTADGRVQSELLAFNQTEIYKAFRFDNFYTLAFHPELTADRMQFLFEHRRKKLLQENFCRNELHLKLHYGFFENVSLECDPMEIFSNFIDLI
jgi:GMP synthase (glutamine-hydrolysing)